MVEYPCWIVGCDFKIEDAPHIESCLQTLREHFRGAHPTKYLNVRNAGEEAARYNQTWEEYITGQLGKTWAEPQYIADVLYYASAMTRVREDAKPQWRKSTIDDAAAWIEANQQAVQEVAGNARAPRFRPGGRPRIR